jgi:hypothetical protein
MFSKQHISRIYLMAVPFLASIIGFSIGHVGYQIYLPLWIINSCLMMVALSILGKQLFKTNGGRYYFTTLLFIVTPWLLFSIFAGMGPPPETIKAYAEAAGEQEVRYGILVLGGILVVPGLVLLKDQLKAAGENLYSLLGTVSILIATPFFILNMVYWGSYLTEAFKIFAASDEVKRPDWYRPVRNCFATISKIEVSLIYAATASFAASFKKVRWINQVAGRAYIFISFLATVLTLLPSSIPGPLAGASYFVSIPAIPFIMLYLMAVNLLAKSGQQIYEGQIAA